MFILVNESENISTLQKMDIINNLIITKIIVYV